MRIDLHAHSTASDGVDSPTRVVEAASEAGLDVVALTDHDTTAGWTEAAEAAQRFGVSLVRGAELSCAVRGINVHLLSYLHDPDDRELNAAIAVTRDDRIVRARAMVELLAEDYPITWEDVLEQTHGELQTVGRPHIADALITRGVVPHRDAAFATLLHRGSRYFRGHAAPEAADLVRLVRRAGGVPVIAHPFATVRGRVISEDDIADLARVGLAGLEVDHQHHDAQARERGYELAELLGLLVTGSSDYHGAARAGSLGDETTTPEVFEALVARASGTSLLA